MFKVFLLSIIILLIGMSSVFAQDLIYKTNKEVIECRIIRIEVKIIKYTQSKYSGETVFAISKKDIEKVVYESGEEVHFNKKHTEAPVNVSNGSSNSDDSFEELLKKQKKNIFKIDFFSPLFGSLAFGYESSLGDNRSFEIKLGGIGLGTQIGGYHKAAGAYGKLGFKIMRSPEVYRNAGHYAHILKGSFVRPEVIFSYFSYNERLNTQTGFSDIRTEAYSVAFLINLGKQWVMDDSFSVSWNIGVGYAISSEGGYYYSHITPGNDFPLALNASLSFGILN